MIKLIVAGSREFNDYDKLKQELDNFVVDVNEPILVVSGTARGADQLGERWAGSLGHEILRFPAEWDKYGKSAGYRRNEQMAKVATHCICFWDGASKGTAHMIKLAIDNGVKLKIISTANGCEMV